MTSPGRNDDARPAAEIVRSLGPLEALRDEWNLLAAATQTPLMRHEWFACCAETLAAEADLRVVIVRRGGRLVAVAPLALVGGAGGKRLELLGMSVLHEPGGLLFADQEALRVLLDAVVALDVPVVLQRLERGSAVVASLQHALPWPGFTVTRAGATALSVPVTTTWSEYQRGLSSRITGNLRRIKARPNPMGPATIAILAPGEAEVDAILEQVMAVEGSGWKGTIGSAMAVKAPLRAFFTAYSRRAAGQGLLRVALLRFGDRIAAVELAVEAYQRWWQLKIGYAGDLARYYPGLQLTEATIRYAFDQRLASYEFLGSAAAWEENWRPEARHYVTAMAYPRTVAGVRALSVDAWRLAGRITVGRLTERLGRS